MSDIKSVKRVGEFLIGGGLTALIGMALLYFLVEHAGLHERTAFAIQLAVTLSINFLFNQAVTWRDAPSAGFMTIRRFGTFLLTRGFSQLVSFGMFALLTTDLIGLHYMAANIVCLLITTVMNYYSSLRFVFITKTSPVQKGPSMIFGLLRGFARNKWMIMGMFLVILCAGIVFVGAYVAIVTATIVTALMFGITATMEAAWRLHGWRTPEAIRAMRFPEPTTRRGKSSFSLIVPAKNEGGVLRHTLELLAQQTHPKVQIIATLIEGDLETIDDAKAAAGLYPGRIEVQVLKYLVEKKPYQLNAALQLCRGDYVGVIDAEDVVAPDLVYAIEAAFQRTGADIIQGGVQLMNIGHRLRDWWCVHNVMEYFSWFSSRMFFQAQQGFVPLGGNTVFIRRDLLLQAGGWPDSLTEDCALGVKLTTEHKAKVAAFYEPRLATREETPDDVHGLVHQRIRWNTGFGVELLGNKWQELPGLRRRMLACYCLATPFLQAAAGLLLPLTILCVLYLDAPVPLVMLTFLPYIPILLSSILMLVGLHEFGRMYDAGVRLRHYLWLGFGIWPYQLILAWSAFQAVHRITTNNMGWYKTPHSNKHRTDLALAPINEIEEIA